MAIPTINRDQRAANAAASRLPRSQLPAYGQLAFYGVRRPWPPTIGGRRALEIKIAFHRPRRSIAESAANGGFGHQRWLGLIGRLTELN
jgi:hypothetical protein